MILNYVLQHKLGFMTVAAAIVVFWGVLFFFMLTWVAGCLLLCLGLVLFLLAKNHPSADLVHRYYQALEKQDYPLAFQHLSPHMGITEAMFLKKEQASDAAQGTMTRHFITNAALHDRQASFTVKVERDGQWSRVYPYLVKEGKQWKIRRFDLSRAIFSNEH